MSSFGLSISTVFCLEFYIYLFIFFCLGFYLVMLIHTIREQHRFRFISLQAISETNKRLPVNLITNNLRLFVAV